MVNTLCQGCKIDACPIHTEHKLKPRFKRSRLPRLGHYATHRLPRNPRRALLVINSLPHGWDQVSADVKMFVDCDLCISQLNGLRAIEDTSNPFEAA